MADTAYETFKAAYKRAKYLYRLHEGLANHRKRAMRCDWAASFCRIMRWSQATAGEIDRVDSPDAIVVLRKGSRLSRVDFATDALPDLLRASIVMLVSAIDAYFHAKIIAHVVRLANKGAHMPKALGKETISVKDFVKARQYKRKMTVVRNALNEKLGYQSLQSPEKVAKALAMIGVSDFWRSVAKCMGAKEKAVTEGLTNIVKRRNRIAHEGDLSQSKKTRNASRVIAPKEVKRALAFSLKLIPRAEKEINRHLR
jgi:hypothetical protein